MVRVPEFVRLFFFLVIFIIEESREKGMIKTKYRYVTFPEREYST